MKKLEKYLETQLKSIDYLLRKPATTYRSVTFHRLRVRIKKLHALLSFLNNCFEDFKMKKSFKPFGKIFHKAGKVRELQIEETRFKRYFSNDSLPQYEIALKKNQSKNREVFFSTLKDFQPEFLKETRKYLQPYIKKVERQHVEKYISKKEDEIKEIIARGLSQTKIIHELRKELKNLQYTQKSTGINSKNELALKSSVLSDLLGKWHDYRVIFKHLEHINAEKVQPAENLKLEKIKLNLTSKSTFLLNQVLAKLPAP